MRASALSDNKIIEDIKMTPRNNCFVAHGEYISGIKSPALKDLLKIGACMSTPLEKKATFNYSWKNINGEDVIIQVTFYAPGSDLPSQVINLRQGNYIPLITWYRMTRPVLEWSEFSEEYAEKERIRGIVKQFEEAAKIHAARQAAAANGFIADVEPFLRESGKILKDARDALHEEFDV